MSLGPQTTEQWSNKLDFVVDVVSILLTLYHSYRTEMFYDRYTIAGIQESNANN